jgi:hypothetical protein
VHLEHGESVSLSHGWLLLLAIKGGQKSLVKKKLSQTCIRLFSMEGFISLFPRLLCHLKYFKTGNEITHKATPNRVFYFIIFKNGMSSKMF